MPYIWDACDRMAVAPRILILSHGGRTPVVRRMYTCRTVDAFLSRDGSNSCTHRRSSVAYGGLFSDALGLQQEMQ